MTSHLNAIMRHTIALNAIYPTVRKKNRFVSFKGHVRFRMHVHVEYAGLHMYTRNVNAIKKTIPKIVEV